MPTETMFCSGKNGNRPLRDAPSIRRLYGPGRIDFKIVRSVVYIRIVAEKRGMNDQADISRNESGSSVVENLPKNEQISAANVLFLEPVFPHSIRIVFGSCCAFFRNEFSGERNANATSGIITFRGATAYGSAKGLIKASGSLSRIQQFFRSIIAFFQSIFLFFRRTVFPGGE